MSQNTNVLSGDLHRVQIRCADSHLLLPDFDSPRSQGRGDDFLDCGIAKMARREPHKLKNAGSNPAPATINITHHKRGGAATVRNNSNETGISRSSHTSAAIRSGRLPGGTVLSRTRVRKTCQVCIRRSRKALNRGLLPGRAISAKTGYEAVVDHRQVPHPCFFRPFGRVQVVGHLGLRVLNDSVPVFAPIGRNSSFSSSMNR